jgi:uncharacterized damage-inducible protein DinB
VPKSETKPFVLNNALLNAYATNNNITRYLIDNVDPKAWRAEPLGGKGRTIAAIVAHIHNVRVMWLKVINKDGPIPEELDRHTVFIGYSISHDAHHRGQISTLARLMGYPLPQKAMFGMWEWGSRDSNAPPAKARSAAAKPKSKKKE